MSRSYRHTPCGGNTTARSEKQDKRFANRRLRRVVGVALHNNAEVMPLLREVSNVWLMEKDGRMYWKDAPAKFMRK